MALDGLVLSTSHTVCSVALFAGGRILARRHEELGRGHAERLVPLIAEVMRQAGATRAPAIVADTGPGSYTGLRVGIAAARALALAWGAPAHGCTATALAAAGALRQDPGLERFLVALAGGRGEVIVQPFATGPLRSLDDPAAVSPTQAHALAAQWGCVAGTAAAEPWPVRFLRAEPDASAAALLPPALATLPLNAHYIRPAEAQIGR